MGLIKDVSEQLNSLDLSVKALRKFAFSMCAALLIVAGLFHSGRPPYSLTALVIAALLAFSGMAFPSVLKGAYRVWMLAAFVMGWVISRIILFFLYYIILTPVGLIARMSGQNFLELKIDRRKESYWIDRDKNTPNCSNKDNRARYEKMY